MVRGLEGAPGTASVFAWLEWLRQFRFYKGGGLSCCCPAPGTWNTWGEILPSLKLMGILSWVCFLSAHTVWYKQRQIPPWEKEGEKKEAKKSISATLIVSLCRGGGTGLVSLTAGDRGRPRACWAEQRPGAGLGGQENPRHRGKERREGAGRRTKEQTQLKAAARGDHPHRQEGGWASHQERHLSSTSKDTTALGKACGQVFCGALLVS